MAKETGRKIDDVLSEMRRKENYLRMMDAKNVNYYKDVSKAINAYYVDPNLAISEMECAKKRSSG